MLVTTANGFIDSIVISYFYTTTTAPRSVQTVDRRNGPLTQQRGLFSSLSGHLPVPGVARKLGGERRVIEGISYS